MLFRINSVNILRFWLNFPKIKLNLEDISNLRTFAPDKRIIKNEETDNSNPYAICAA